MKRNVGIILFLILFAQICFPQTEEEQVQINKIRQEIKELKQQQKKIQKAIILKEKELELLISSVKAPELPKGSAGIVTLKSEGKIKEKPKLLGKILAVVPNGSEIPIFYESSGDYVVVQYDNQRGYMHTRYIASIPSGVKNHISLQEADERQIVLEAKWGKSKASRIMRGEIWVGMTSDMVIESIGHPEEINRTATSTVWGTREQWIYPKGVCLYFENDVLTAWQD